MVGALHDCKLQLSTQPHCQTQQQGPHGASIPASDRGSAVQYQKCLRMSCRDMPVQLQRHDREHVSTWTKTAAPRPQHKGLKLANWDLHNERLQSCDQHMECMHACMPGDVHARHMECMHACMHARRCTCPGPAAVLNPLEEPACPFNLWHQLFCASSLKAIGACALPSTIHSSYICTCTCMP